MTPKIISQLSDRFLSQFPEEVQEDLKWLAIEEEYKTYLKLKEAVRRTERNIVSISRKENKDDKSVRVSEKRSSGYLRSGQRRESQRTRIPDMERWIQNESRK